MIISQQGLDLIKRFEGFSPTPYVCPAGKWTIGYGHVIRPDESFTEVSRMEGERLLTQDVMGACAAVQRLITVPLSQGQFDALVSFTFNLGSARLQSSTLRQCLNRGDYEAAAEQFGRWVYAGGRKLTGLVWRRAAEAELFALDDGGEPEDSVGIPG